MTIEFQEVLLKYLLQDKDSKKYARYLDQNLFDSGIYKQILLLWKSYIKEFRAVPSRANLLEFAHVEKDKTKWKIPEDIWNELLDTIKLLYVPLNSDTGFIKSRIVDFAMQKRTRKLLIKGGELLDNKDDSVYDWAVKEMNAIRALKNDDADEQRKHGGYLLRDRAKYFDADTVEGTPIMLKSINRMTNARGFHAPQSIVFVKAPKAFGTGLLMNIAVDLMMQGKRVAWWDSDNNGVGEVRMRLKQCILQCERHEVKNYTKEYDNIANRILLTGGDIRIYSFDSNKDTLDDVEQTLINDRDNDGWVPEFVINDYLDKFRCSDRSIKNRNEQLQHLYDHQNRLNSTWGFASFTISPISGDAADKWYFNERDFAGDKAKAYNCYAAFAYCRVEAEMKQGTAHLHPIVQRSGVSNQFNAFTTCAIKIDEKRMLIEELDSELYLATMRDYIPDGTTAVAPTRKKNFKQKVTDD